MFPVFTFKHLQGISWGDITVFMAFSYPMGVEAWIHHWQTITVDVSEGFLYKTLVCSMDVLRARQYEAVR